MSPASRTNSPKTTTAPRRRKPGAERRAEIAAVAGELFAAEGFQVSTRQISAALGITQAALYKHFKSKDALIEEVFSSRYLQERQSDFADILLAGEASLEHRLAAAYIDFYHRITSTSLRLFQRASYDGLELAKRYSPHLDDRVLVPVVNCLRTELNMPSVENKALIKEERDLALMLHSSMVFLAIRKFVYHIDFKDQENDIIMLQVRAWLPGTLILLAQLHESAST